MAEIAVCAALLIAVAQSHSAWTIHEVDDTVGYPLDTSLALNSSNLPSVSYVDAVNGGLKFASFDGVSWTTSTLDSVGGRYSSLGFDNSGLARISYGSSGNLKYASFDGSSWSVTTVDAGAGGFTSLALDGLGRPHISYRSGTGGDLKYTFHNGTSWTTTTVDSAGSLATYTSLALDSLGHAHIAYYDLTNEDLKYAAFDGASWVITTLDSTGDVGKSASLRLDSADRPHIAYLDDSNNDLKYAFFDGVSWSLSIVDPTSSSAPAGHAVLALALDSADQPRIGYYASWSGAGLKYAAYDGVSWDLSEVQGTTGYGLWPSIAMDSTGDPWISYMGGDFDLRVATLAEPVPEPASAGLAFALLVGALAGGRRARHASGKRAG